MRNPNKSFLPSLANLLRAINSSVLPGVLLVSFLVFANSWLGTPARWLSPGNLATLVLLQLSIFAFTETRRIDRALGSAESIFAHYLGFLRRYAWWALLFLALLVASGLLVLPSRAFEALFGPVFALFGLAIFLAASDVSDEFAFFRRITISPSSVAAILLGAAFVSAYSYLSVFVPFGFPAPFLSSGLLGALFLWGMVSLGSGARTAYARYRLAAGHMASRRAEAGLRFARISVSFAVLASVGFVAKQWYAVSVFSPSSVQSAQPLPDDFGPVLDRFVAELDDLERSGAASSGSVAPASGIREDGDASSKALVASGSTYGASRTGSIASSWSLVATASGSVSGHEEAASEPQIPAKPATTAQRIRDIFPGKRYLGLGNTGEDVLWIQRLLKREGYYSGPLDSTFSEATSVALAKFMRARARVNYDYTQLGPKAMEIFKGIAVEE